MFVKTVDQRYKRQTLPSFSFFDNENDLNKCLMQISNKIYLLLQLTHSLKCAAYKMVKIPVENYKSKLKPQNSSLLTNIDSIFYDLKRVQTILEDKSKTYQIFPQNHIKQGFSRNKSDINYDSWFQRSQYSRSQAPNQILRAKEQNSYYFHIQKPSRSTTNQDDRKIDLKKTIKLNTNTFLFDSKNGNLLQIQNKVNKPSMSKNFSLSQKQFKEMKISKVSSVEQFGIQTFAKVKTEPKNIVYANSPQHSRIKSPIDMRELEQKQLMKERQAQQFIRQMQKNRQKCLSNIHKKAQKCYETLNKMWAISIPQQASLSQNQLKQNRRRKSRTQKFNKSERGGSFGQNQDQQNKNQTTLSWHN